MGGQKANRKTDSHETRLLAPRHLKKVLVRNGMVNGLPVIEICMKTAFSSKGHSKTEFFGFGGSKGKP